jgi:hypothetical protein
MSSTALRKRRSLPPPVPPPLDFDIYSQALYGQTAALSAPDAQAEEQIKHVGWQAIEATNHKTESLGSRLKERILPILERVKGLPSETKVFIDKFTPFQILGSLLIVTAALLLLAAKNQAWFILAISGAAQIAIDIVLKKKVAASS